MNLKPQDSQMRQEQVNFDTYKYVKDFEKAGFKLEQAEALVQTISASRDFDLSRLATKDQIFSLEKDIHSTQKNIESLEKDIKSLDKDIKNLDEKLSSKIDGVEERLRSEMKANLAEMKDEMKANLVDMKANLDEMKTSQTEMKVEITSMHTVIKETSLSNLRWIISTILTVFGILLGVAYKILAH